MDDLKKKLKGSPSRDIFKHLHKQYMPKQCYGTDLDFVLIAKYPNRIVAFVDYKGLYDTITFSETIAYNILKDIAPVYIIQSNNPEEGPFTIYQYLNGDPAPEPPKVKLELINTFLRWADLKDWESRIRIFKLKKAGEENTGYEKIWR